MRGGVRLGGRRLVLLLAGVLLTGATVITPSAAPDASGERVDFRRDIQPILEASCTKCHGATRQRGQLRLDSRSFALHGSVTGPVIIPGDSARSRLAQIVAHPDPAERMPQPATAAPLSPERIQLIKRWIDQGAAWPETPDEARYEPHWAYGEPARPSPPRVRDARWVRNPIDAFVLARLEREGLTPSAEAERATLIRRVSLDLDGPAADPGGGRRVRRRPGPPAPTRRSSTACSRRPTTASAGRGPGSTSPATPTPTASAGDRPRTMWPYRDWVIHALNRDMPFDPVHDRADRRRPAAGRHRRPDDRDRLPPQHDDERGRRHGSPTRPAGRR